jgi:L-idonate 5-dehydrogenase
MGKKFSALGKRACVLHTQEGVRIGSVPVGETGPNQLLIRVGAGLVCF